MQFVTNAYACHSNLWRDFSKDYNAIFEQYNLVGAIPNIQAELNL